MAGITATINVQTLRVQWASHSSMFAICSYWTITKDQLIRLRDVVPLPKRHDRRLRFKPERQRDPTQREIAQACREIQARWDEHTRHERLVSKPQGFQLRQIETPDELRQYVEGDQ
jgi:hypothetical protein